MDDTTYEIRVRIELLHPHTGAVVVDDSLLSAITDEGPEPGFLGDIESSIDAIREDIVRYGSDR